LAQLKGSCAFRVLAPLFRGQAVFFFSFPPAGADRGPVDSWRVTLPFSRASPLTSTFLFVEISIHPFTGTALAGGLVIIPFSFGFPDPE